MTRAFSGAAGPRLRPAVPPDSRHSAPLWAAGWLASAFAILSLLAVALGCFVAASAGAGPALWGRNAAAWLIGAWLTRLSNRLPPAVLLRAALLFSPVLLLISLCNTGQSGVHRWISLGPMNWNVASLCLPSAAVGFAAMSRAHSRWAWWSVLVIGLLLCLQPDASQATAFAWAILVTLFMARTPGLARAIPCLLVLLGVGIAWTRPDPLLPVPQVEGILHLARAVSFWTAALCWTLLAAVALTPLLAWNKALPDARPPAAALCAYYLGCTFTPLFGVFPVPLVGMGMSPIIGFWFGIGALMAASSVESANSPREKTPPLKQRTGRWWFPTRGSVRKPPRQRLLAV